MSKSAVIALFCLLGLAVYAKAQPADYVELPFTGAPSDPIHGCAAQDGHYDEKKLAALAGKHRCAETAAARQAAAEQKSIAHWSAGSDCHMQVALKVFRSDTKQEYLLVVNVISGGCRAGGWKSGWVMFEKMRPGYNFRIEKVGVDRRGRGVDPEFVFPKPPAAVFTTPVAVREVDVQDCLPLTGQSQWVIRERHFAIDRLAEKDRARCTELIDRLVPDFNAETLIGYSFSSGHCYRPEGIELTATNYISEDIKLLRTLIVVSQPKARAVCHVWRTHPVWMVIPRQPHLRYDFETVNREPAPRSANVESVFPQPAIKR